MKKLIVLAFMMLLTGCNGAPSDPVFGEGTEYTFMELSFSTASEVEYDYIEKSVTIKDGINGFIEITYEPFSEDMTTAAEDISDVADLNDMTYQTMSQDESIKAFSERNEGTAEIDGFSADTAMCCLDVVFADNESFYSRYLETAKVSTERFCYSISYCSYMDNRLPPDEYKERAKNIYYGIDIEPVPVTEYEFTDDWSDLAAGEPVSTDVKHTFQNGLTFMLPEGYWSEAESPFSDTTYAFADKNGDVSYVNLLTAEAEDYIRCYDKLQYMSGSVMTDTQIQDIRHITVNGIETVYISTDERDTLLLSGNGTEYYLISINNSGERDITGLILSTVSF